MSEVFLYMYMHIRCMYIEVQVPVHAQNPLGVRTFHQVIQTRAICTVLVVINLQDQNRKDQAPPLGNPVFKEIYWHCFRPENALAPISGGGGKQFAYDFFDFSRKCGNTVGGTFLRLRTLTRNGRSLVLIFKDQKSSKSLSEPFLISEVPL